MAGNARRSEIRKLLNVQVADTITQPSDVALKGDRLLWEAEYRLDTGEIVNGAVKPVKGCLEDFTALAYSASATDVLDFVQRRGVLAVNPVVTSISHPWRESADVFYSSFSRGGGLYGVRASYEEPVEVYRDIASHMKGMIGIVHKLRREEPISQEVSDYFQLRDPHRPPGLTQDWRSKPGKASVYSAVQNTARLWQQIAGLKLEIPLSPTVGFSATQEIEYRLLFGGWGDGADWDEEYDPAPDEFGLYRLDRETPFRGQRPSALFSVLAYQFLEAVTLPAGMYQCDYCGQWFMPDGRQRKPRNDRNNYCPDKDCAEEAERKRSRESKQKAAKKKREAGLLAVKDAPCVDNSVARPELPM